MYLKTIKDNFWFTLMCIIVFAICVMLSFWQFERLTWKNEAIKSVEENIILPPVKIIGRNSGEKKSPNEFNIAYECATKKCPVFSGDIASDLEYRKVKIKGKFLHDKEFHQAVRYMRGKLGYHILTPFELENGAVLIVNRGWIPTDKKDKKNYVDKIVEDIKSAIWTSEIDGIIPQKNVRKGWFTPDNDRIRNIWFYPDLAEMEDYLKKSSPELENVKFYPVIIQQMAENNTPDEDSLPQLLKFEVNIINDHMQYMITWISLALITIVMLSFYLRSKTKGE